jgi:hypothetical protein
MGGVGVVANVPTLLDWQPRQVGRDGKDACTAERSDLRGVSGR